MSKITFYALVLFLAITTGAIGASKYIEDMTPTIPQPNDSIPIGRVKGGPDYKYTYSGLKASFRNMSSTTITGTSLSPGSVYYMSTTGLALAKGDGSTDGAGNIKMPGICVAISTTQCSSVGVYTAVGTIGGGTVGASVYTSDLVAGGMQTIPTATTGHYFNKIGVLIAPNTIQILPSLNVFGL